MSLHPERDPLETRIVITRDRRGRATITLWSPTQRKHIETGMHAGPDPLEIEERVLAVKATLERKGLHVTFCERSS